MTDEGGTITPIPDKVAAEDGWPECAHGPMVSDHGTMHLGEAGDIALQITLDDLQARNGLPVDAITMDVEGSELAVLDGARRVLIEHRPLVWVSIHPEQLANYDATRTDVLDALTDVGYETEHLAAEHELHTIAWPSERADVVLPYGRRNLGVTGGHLLVTGAGRSGTGYLAAVLNGCGVRCGHEEVFDCETVLDETWPAWGEFQADCSWLAVPLLTGADRVVSVHLVRDPRSVAGSLAELQFFAEWHPPDEYSEIIEAFAPDVFQERTQLDRALLYWLRWAEAADRVTQRRVLPRSLDAPTVATLASAVTPTTTATAAAALAVTPRTNTKREDSAVLDRPAWGEFRVGLRERAQVLWDFWSSNPEGDRP